MLMTTPPEFVLISKREFETGLHCLYCFREICLVSEFAFSLPLPGVPNVNCVKKKYPKLYFLHGIQKVKYSKLETPWIA